MIKVLEVVSSLALGGTEAFVMNLYRKIDKSVFQVDFICFSHQNIAHDEEIIESGGNVYFLDPPGASRIWTFEQELRQIVLKNHGYDVIHAHCDGLNGVIMRAAARCGIAHRFSHAHCAYLNTFRNLPDWGYQKLKKHWVRKYTEKMLACSEEAARCVYGGVSGVEIVHNGIDVQQFAFPDQAKIDSIKKDLKIPADALVVGNVGRFDQNKNQTIIVDIIAELRKKGLNAYAVLVGPDAGEKGNVSSKAESMNLQTFVKILPARRDVAELLGVMDACILPSMREALCISAVEAQAAGNPVYLSDTIPKDADMGVGLVTYLSLTSSPAVWAQRVAEGREKNVDKSVIQNAFRKNGYDIQSTVTQMEKLYGRYNGQCDCACL